MFYCEFCEIFKNIFFTEHHWVTTSGVTNDPLVTQKVCLNYTEKLGRQKKKCIVVSGWVLHEHSGFKAYFKLCLILCSRKWLKPNRDLVSSLKLTWSCKLKNLFSEGLMKFIKVET